MSSPIYCFDPTIKDNLSKVRGIGRYLQLLKENFAQQFVFTDSLNKIDFNSTLINPFFNFLQPPLLMKRVANKQIAIIHDLIPLKYPQHFPLGIKGKINVMLNKLSLNNYDLIITDSLASKKDIIKMLGLSENKIYVVYPCLPKFFTDKNVDNKPWNTKIKNNSLLSMLNTPFCLYVGDATWNKNIVNLAKAIKKINVTCVFVGKVFKKRSVLYTNSYYNPWQKELKQFMDEIKDDKRFVLNGFVTDGELINLYQQTRCNILPSRDEGFGFSYVESANFGCPSVLSDIPVFHEISAESAIFTEPENVDNLANAIGELYFNSQKQISLGKKAKLRSGFFSAKNFQKTFLDLIEKNVK